MIEFEYKKKIKKRLYSKTVLLILFIIIIFLAQSTWSVYKKSSLSRQNMEKAKGDLMRLQNRHSTLSVEIEKLQTEQGIEEEIRNKYRLVKEGESVAVIIDGEDDNVEIVPPPPDGFWTKTKSFFGFN
jgi:cell division protein FtsB